MPPATQPLLIIGASARAAAQSAARAGFQVSAIDLFADDDLAACAEVRRSHNYPHDLARLAATCADGPWMYCGGLENHPAIVERINRTRPLLGNSAALLHRVRDPLALQEVLRDAGLPSVPTTLAEYDIPRDGSWLRKPLRGSGGANITQVGREAADDDRVAAVRRDAYFQQMLPGPSASAIFVADGRRATLLDITRQLVGPPWTERPFQYAGSIGPLDLSPRSHDQISRCGAVIAGTFELRGLFGVDGILSGAAGNEQFHVVEVNPRYTASCEVVEAMLADAGIASNMIGLHDAACTRQTLPDLSHQPVDRRAHGKLIVYSRGTLVVDEALRSFIERTNQSQRYRIADIPPLGAAIERGHPAFTLLANSATAEGVLNELTNLRQQVMRAIARAAQSDA